MNRTIFFVYTFLLYTYLGASNIFALIIPVDNGKQDGRIKDNGVTNVGGISAYIGDIANTDREWYSLFGVNLKAVPTNANILSAVFYVYSAGPALGDPTVCNPYTVDFCDFGSNINPGDEITNSDYTNSFYQFNYVDLGWYGIPCTNLVRFAVTNRKSWVLDGSDRWFQIRIRPTVYGTGSDNYAKLTTFENTSVSKHAYLDVEYTTPSTSGPFYVDDDSGYDGNPGTFEYPLATIQEAVDRASKGPPFCTSATVYVFPGVYNEKIAIYSNKNSGYLVITRLSNTMPVLSGEDVKWSGFTLYSNVNKIKINGFVIKRYTSTGIRLVDNSCSNEIVNNIFLSNVDAGVKLSYAPFRNCIVSNEIIGGKQQNGIIINASDYNTVLNNYISSHIDNGILVDNNSISNNIKYNTICSNLTNGIKIAAGVADNNFIISNNIFGEVQKNGIYINDSDNIFIKGNNIYSHFSNGILLLGNAKSNTICNNEIYLNKFYGICTVNIGGDYNTIFSNVIWGDNQNSAIYMMNGNYNIIRYNTLYKNQKNAILGAGRFSTNFISHNIIYSNDNEGIFLRGGNVIHNKICSNIIYGNNQNIGFRLKNANKNDIFRNLVYNCSNYGIYSELEATNNRIINNTIYNSLNGSGIYFTNTSSATLYNNIILSNSKFGIENIGSGIINIRYSDIFGNVLGPTNNRGTGKLIWGLGNWLTDPIIDTTGDFTITSPESYAYDQAKVIKGISDNYLGRYPDMGWKECSLSTTATLYISKSIDGITDPLGGNNAIPGASIVYNIITTNRSERNSFNNIIIDKLPSAFMFFTNISMPADWIFEVATNSSPDMSWESSDFFNAGAVTDKNRIIYIRWKGELIEAGNKVNFQFKVVIK